MANLLKMMEKAAESFENLAIHDSRCLQMISSRSKCTVCIDACPTGGIEIHSGSIEVSSCISCGICAKVCPTDTFIWKYPTYESVYSNLKEASDSNQAIIFSCIKSPLNMLEAPLIKIPSFSYLLNDIWTILLNMKQGYIFLPEDGCNECNHKCEIPEKVRSIRLYCETDVRKILNEDGVDRRKREFLGSIVSYVNEFNFRKWLKKEEVTTEFNFSIKQTLGHEAAELPLQVAKKSQPMGVHINSHCRSCKACSMLCPRGALEQITNDSEKTTVIVIDHDRCSLCGLCVDICYFEAILIEEKKSPQGFEHFQV